MRAVLYHHSQLVRVRLTPWAAAPHLTAQVIGEVFCWTRNPMEVRRLATRKLQIFRDNVARSVEEVRAQPSPASPHPSPDVEKAPRKLRHLSSSSAGGTAGAECIHVAIHPEGSHTLHTQLDASSMEASSSSTGVHLTTHAHTHTLALALAVSPHNGL